MGVSVYAFDKAYFLREGWMTDDEWENYDNLRQVYAYDGFAQSTRGFKNHDKSFKEGLIAEGVYEISKAKRMEMMSTSYGSYGEFRGIIAKEFGLSEIGKMDEIPDSLRVLPFFEFVWFADNEGAIGPDACSDLALDFEAHCKFFLDKFKSSEDYHIKEYYPNYYLGMMAGFRHAADTGFVSLS